MSFLAVGQETSEAYSTIAADLRAKGRPIPANDVWIAAHVVETGADLIAPDSHFEQVDGITWTRIAARLA